MPLGRCRQLLDVAALLGGQLLPELEDCRQLKGGTACELGELHPVGGLLLGKRVFRDQGLDLGHPLLGRPGEKAVFHGLGKGVQPVVVTPQRGQITNLLLGGKLADLLVELTERFLLIGGELEIESPEGFRKLACAAGATCSGAWTWPLAVHRRPRSEAPRRRQ